jgi:hypothetical protein
LSYRFGDSGVKKTALVLVALRGMEKAKERNEELNSPYYHFTDIIELEFMVKSDRLGTFMEEVSGVENYKDCIVNGDFEKYGDGGFLSSVGNDILSKIKHSSVIYTKDPNSRPSHCGVRLVFNAKKVRANIEFKKTLYNNGKDFESKVVIGVGKYIDSIQVLSRDWKALENIDMWNDVSYVEQISSGRYKEKYGEDMPSPTRTMEILNSITCEDIKSYCNKHSIKLEIVGSI